MVFNSLHYFHFLLVVFPLFLILPKKVRMFMLLAASCYFYMSWKPEYILLLLVSSSIDYSAAIRIHGSTSQRTRKLLLLCSMSANLGILFFFKYLDFFLATTVGAMEPMNLLLPVGISFYTFQAMSYTIDIYRGVAKPERNFLTFALFITYFPQLVAGPIERSQDLIPQLKGKFQFSYERTVSGLTWIVWGLFKKIVIADRAAIYVNEVFGNPNSQTTLRVLVGTYLFAYQIYCDFSGYSDIALGTARIFGVDLMKNFSFPYFSRSIPEFWNRWHVSLSQWFRDYLYIPLGGNRASRSRWYTNLLIVFLVSGLWHGAKWTFVAWGAIHGVATVLTYLSRDKLGEWQNKAAWVGGLKALVTFHIVCISWIFFRADSMSDAMTLLGRLSLMDLSLSGLTSGLGTYEFALGLAFIAGLEVIQFTLLQEKLKFAGTSFRYHWAAMLALVTMIFVFGEFRSQQFVYFQF